MSYTPKHYKLYELLPEDVYTALIKELKEDVIWKLFDEDLLRGLDWLKDLFPEGSITINDWKWGGGYQHSGLRPKSSKYYSEGSMHSVGLAADLKFSKYSIGEVLNKLRIVEDSPYIRRVEKGTDTWVHVDVKPTGRNNIYFFNP